MWNYNLIYPNYPIEILNNNFDYFTIKVNDFNILWNRIHNLLWTIKDVDPKDYSNLNGILLHQGYKNISNRAWYIKQDMTIQDSEPIDIPSWKWNPGEICYRIKEGDNSWSNFILYASPFQVGYRIQESNLNWGRFTLKYYSNEDNSLFLQTNQPYKFVLNQSGRWNMPLTEFFEASISINLLDMGIQPYDYFEISFFYREGMTYHPIIVDYSYQIKLYNENNYYSPKLMITINNKDIHNLYFKIN